MRYLDGRFAATHGLELYYQSWLPQCPLKAVVGMVHGLGSHSGWFVNLVKPLVAHGYGVYSFDLRGHGQSPGQRGHINTWTEFREDFHSFWQMLQNQHPEIPCFALGHSLGGIIVLEYSLRYPKTLPGIITLAPAIGPVGVSPMKLAVGKLLSWSWPRFTLDTGLDQNGGSRDRAIITAYESDRLRHTKGTARLATEFLKTRQWVQTKLPDLTAPILILHGSHDSVTLPESGRLAFERLQMLDKEYREYPQAYHDLHNDICAPRVFQDILHWLERHTNVDLRFCPLQGSTTVGCLPPTFKSIA